MNQTPDEVTTLAYYLVVQRPDGIGFAGSSHDQRLFKGSKTFEADVDLRVDELLLTDQLFGSKFEVSGSVTGTMTVADLRAKRWSGASAELLAGDWNENLQPDLICEGELGQVRMVEGKMSLAVDLIPVAASLPPCIQTSTECRAILGDWHCRVDLRSRKRRIAVSALDPDGIAVEGLDVEPFAMGRLRWISGLHCGVEQMIIAASGNTLMLKDASHFPASIGDRAIIIEGCDGRRSTCSQRFQNILNFRGEPDLPGSDVFLRFPGA